MTLVSIVTPSYNQAAFLEDTLHSVLLQTAQSSSPKYSATPPVQIEYCVVDGGSTDGSQAVIERHADQLAWWVSEADHGQADAINKGFRRATGEIVAWLNSDDLYLPGAIQTAVSALQSNPNLGMVYGDALTIDETGRPINRLSFRDWELVDLLKFRVICQPAVFMRRSVLEQAGYLNPSFHYMLDHHLWIRMARLAPIRHIPEILAAARQHADAKNVRQAAGFSQETGQILDWIQTQPDLASLFSQNRRAILGGASRLQARYYLDGDQPSMAMHYYARAARYSPAYALQHWHRMLYALLCMAGLKNLADRGLRPASARRKAQNIPDEYSHPKELQFPRNPPS